MTSLLVTNAHAQLTLAINLQPERFHKNVFTVVPSLILKPFYIS